jgi:hypothetical protein
VTDVWTLSRIRDEYGDEAAALAGRMAVRQSASGEPYLLPDELERLEVELARLDDYDRGPQD